MCIHVRKVVLPDVRYVRQGPDGHFFITDIRPIALSEAGSTFHSTSSDTRKFKAVNVLACLCCTIYTGM